MMHQNRPSTFAAHGLLKRTVAVVALFALSVATTFAIPAANDHTVLILSTSVTGGTSSQEANRAAFLGLSVEIVTPTQWATMTTSDFASYRAIVLGDPNCSEN